VNLPPFFTKKPRSVALPSGSPAFFGKNLRQIHSVIQAPELISASLNDFVSKNGSFLFENMVNYKHEYN